MKRILYVLTLLLSIAAAGCKKDIPSASEKIIGQWTYIKAIEKNGNNPEIVYPADVIFIYTFEKNGSLTISKNGTPLVGAFTWKLTGDKLLRFNDQDPTYTITKLDGHDLIYYEEYANANGTTRYTKYYTK
jgi:hypothetical protein